MEASLRQQYLNYYITAHNLILEISKNTQLLEDQNMQQLIAQLQECFYLPVTKESIQFFARKITNLVQYMDKEKSSIENNIDDGKNTGYTKVKKSGNAFVPVEETSKDIEVPNYNPLILKNRNSLRQIPDYITDNKVIRVSPVPNDYNRGSSHVLMLAFLTFFMESLFLLLAFFLYH